VKDLRHKVVADVFRVALLFLVTQMVVITTTAWAENPQSGTACSFEVKPDFTPLSEISPYYIDALIAADDPNFYNRTPEQTARVYEFFKTIVDAGNIKALQNHNIWEEDVRVLKDIFDPVKITPAGEPGLPSRLWERPLASISANLANASSSLARTPD
jgi:hypothetical protein